jgi:AcrR family transcriptional regulator
MAPVEDQAAPDGRADEPTVARPRRRRGPPLIVQDDVVEAAMALLDEGGWEALSMRAVCRRLELSLPTVYAVARSRETVVELAGARGLEAWARRWQGGDQPDDLRAAAAAMAARPWLFDLVRLQPPTARAAVARLPEPILQRVAALGPSTPSLGVPDTPVVDRALVVWMLLELAHRLEVEGLGVAGLAPGLLEAVLGTGG